MIEIRSLIFVLHIIFQDNIVEGEVNVDPKHHKHFVARRGEVLRQIADDFGGVTVSFPRSGVKSDRVVIKGAKDCVEGAKKRILEIVADLVGSFDIRGGDIHNILAVNNILLMLMCLLTPNLWGLHKAREK